MKIPESVREAMGSLAPDVPFQMADVAVVAERTGLPREEVVRIVYEAGDRLIERRLDPSGNVVSWVLKPDEPLESYEVKMLLLDNQAHQNFLPDAQVSHALIPVDRIPEIHRKDVERWVQSVGGRVATKDFGEDNRPTAPGTAFIDVTFEGVVDFYVVPADALVG